MQDDAIVVAAGGLGHVLKVRVLRELSAGKASPSELAERMGEKLGNVSYHVRQLHQAGFLGKAGTRPVRGAVEHFYVVSDQGREQVALLRAATGELLAAGVRSVDGNEKHAGATVEERAAEEAAARGMAAPMPSQAAAFLRDVDAGLVG